MAKPARTVKIHSKQRVFDGRFKIDEIVYSHTRCAGPGVNKDVRRLVFERGDSAAVLLHDVERDVIILGEQFRIATYAKGPGYILEAVAGSVEPGETPDACIKRELMEEVGYRVRRLRRIGQFYVSPGGASERIILFYAAVRPRDLVDPSASGLAAEKEDVRRVEIRRTTFLDRLRRGVYEDAKIMVAGLWLASQPGQGAPAAA